MSCYFGQTPKRKGSISLSNFDEKLQNILFTSLCLYLRILRVAAVAYFQSARGVYFCLVWLDSKSYGVVSKAMGGEGYEYYMKMLNVRWKSI